MLSQVITRCKSFRRNKNSEGNSSDIRSGQCGSTIGNSTKPLTGVTHLFSNKSVAACVDSLTYPLWITSAKLVAKEPVKLKESYKGYGSFFLSYVLGIWAGDVMSPTMGKYACLATSAWGYSVTATLEGKSLYEGLNVMKNRYQILIYLKNVELVQSGLH